MANTQYHNHLETEILSADPMKLVIMLYRGAIDSVAAARRHLQAGRVRERSRQITRASEIINELMRSLDWKHGGQISRSLGELYAYMLTKLIQANTRQADPPLAEVQRLLSTLLEGWSKICKPEFAAQPADAAYEPVSCAC